MSDTKTNDSILQLIGDFLREDVLAQAGVDGDGRRTIKLIDKEQEIGIEISAEIASSMSGYHAELRVVEIDSFTPPALTDKQGALPLERGRIGYYFWNRAGGFEGPLRISSNPAVRFTSENDSDADWHHDGRYAWAGDKNHKHPRDLVKRIVPPGEEPDEE